MSFKNLERHLDEMRGRPAHAATADMLVAFTHLIVALQKMSEDIMTALSDAEDKLKAQIARSVAVFGTGMAQLTADFDKITEQVQKIADLTAQIGKGGDTSADVAALSAMNDELQAATDTFSEKLASVTQTAQAAATQTAQVAQSATGQQAGPA